MSQESGMIQSLWWWWREEKHNRGHVTQRLFHHPLEQFRPLSFCNQAERASSGIPFFTQTQRSSYPLLPATINPCDPVISSSSLRLTMYTPCKNGIYRLSSNHSTDHSLDRFKRYGTLYDPCFHSYASLNARRTNMSSLSPTTRRRNPTTPTERRDSPHLLKRAAQ